VQRDGLTRSQAEREFRRLQDQEERRPAPRHDEPRHTFSEAGDALRRQFALQGARRSYLEGLRVDAASPHAIAPRRSPLEKVTTAHVEALASVMLAAGRAPKTVRNLLTFVHSIFEHAIDLGWTGENPVVARRDPSTDGRPTRTPICVSHDRRTGGSPSGHP